MVRQAYNDTLLFFTICLGKSPQRFKLIHKTWVGGYNGRFHQTFRWNVYIADLFFLPTKHPDGMKE